MSTIGYFYPGNTIQFKTYVVESNSGQAIVVDSVKFYVFLSKDFSEGGSPIATLDGFLQSDNSYTAIYTLSPDCTLGTYIVKIEAVKGNIIATDYIRFVVHKTVDV